jgi:hypothetical protein
MQNRHPGNALHSAKRKIKGADIAVMIAHVISGKPKIDEIAADPLK